MAVQRILTQCNTCKATTLLRFQIGYETMPIAIGCNNCGIVLKGKYQINNNELTTSLELTNATVIGGANWTHGQEVECSGEFPTRRFTTGAGDFRLSPFINSIQIMSEENMTDFSGRINSFRKEWKNNGSKLQDAFKLYKNKKYQLMNKMLLEATQGSISDDEQKKEYFFYHVVVGNLIAWLYPDNNKNNISPVNSLFRSFTMSSTLAKDDLIQMNNKVDIQEHLNRGLELHFRFLEQISSFIPAMCISFAEKNSKEYLNGDYIITSFDFETNKSFFVDSYEWLSKNLFFPVGLHNFIERKNFSDMKVTSTTKNLKVSTIDDFIKLDHGKKKEITGESNSLSRIHEQFWNNGQLRNAIQHFKYAFDPVTQQIKYYPYKDLKKSTKFKEISLIKFAYLSFQSMQAVHQGITLLISLERFRKGD